jgi:hypothetical protein
MATELRKRVADILHSEHRVSTTRLRGLSVKDTAELHAIAGGTRLPEFRIKALNIVAAIGDPAAADVFRHALRDPAGGTEVRAAGATWLSRLGGMAAEGALLESLATEAQPIVQHKVVGGLARVGGEAALRRLTDAAQAMGPALREHVQFAQAVIACRAGLAGHALPLPDPAALLPAPAAAHASAQFAAAAPEQALRVIDQTRADSHGVAGETETVGMLQCGRRTLAAVVHAPLRGGVADLLARPAVVGHIAVRAEVDDSFSTGLLILSWPDGHGGVQLAVNRLSGRAMYAGAGRLEGEAIQFRLDALRGPGATETTLTGTLAGGRLAALQVVTGATTERLQPLPM